MEPDEILLLPHTHWDREWYLPFEAFLSRLVEMMDGLIELLDAEPRFAHFHLDGQATVIDDYLNVRPEREADVRRLAAAGRISVGPWYTQMDEFLVSGESLVRNLEWGLRRAAELGAEAPPAGYLPDQFGHVGQMPQILRNAGLERAVVWRGVPSAIDRTVFLWEAPDGSRVLTEYLAFGYGLGGWMVQAEDSEALAGHLRKAVELLAPLSPRDRLLVPVGGDHQVPARKLAPLLADAARQVGVRARMGSIADYVGPDEVPDPLVWRGELRSAARAHLLPGVYSTRAHQKRDRAQIEVLVERYAEPLAALMPGYEWPEKELRDAWRLLLWNGAHDSVCGCSVDEVAREVDGRYGEAGAIANNIIEASLAALAAGMGRAGTMYFNPSPFERLGVPGLGWRVGVDVPVDRQIPIHVEGGRLGILEYGGLQLRLVDEGDAGDLYNFCPAPGAPAVEPDDLVERDGLVEARFDGVTVELRAEQGPEERSLRLAVRIVNERPDHRLRLHVGIDGPASGSVALAPFEVVERPLTSEGGTETPSPTWPARGAVLAGGVAVFREGVFEYEVIPDPPELAVTLLRCVGTISRPEIATRSWAAGPDIATPDAQMIGEHHMWLGIRRGGRPSELPSEWERAMLPLLAVPARGGGDLPESGSLLRLSGAELSSVRRVEGRVEVRMWNPSPDVRDAVVDGRPIRLGPARIEKVRPGGD